MSMDSPARNVTELAAGKQGSEVTETTAERATEQTVEALPVDAIFEVLKNERRRRVIQYLRSTEGAVELGDVAEHIAALENDKEQAQISYAERKRVYVGLYQCHLPKMDDMGVVEFNRARGRIERTEQTEQLVPYIEGPVSRRPWHRYYGATLLGGGGLAAVAGVVPGVVAPQFVMIALLVAVAGVTTAHTADATR